MSRGPRTGLLLVNVGTPDAPRTPEVRRYLREFLSDPRVLDIPAPARKALLELVILPFRPRRSAEAYEAVWTERGSPLLVHSMDLAAGLRQALGDGWVVEVGMRYGNPSLHDALERLRRAECDRIVVFPQFPQYSSAATGTAVARVFELLAGRWNLPSVRVVAPFYEDRGFVGAFASCARPVLDDFRPDHVLLSFHGLPERHVRKGDESGGAHCLASPGCCASIVSANRNCYRAQCHATARALAGALGLPDGGWEIAFQSRLGRDPWIRPFTDQRVRELAASGVRRLAVAAPSFTADCLETLEEIGMRARDDFLAHGGEAFAMIPCPNASAEWVRAAADLVLGTSSAGRGT